MLLEPEIPPRPMAPARIAGLRGGVLLVITALMLTACGSGREDKLAEQIAAAKSAATHAEKAQKAAELALAKLEGVQKPQTDEPDDKEDPQVVEGDDSGDADADTDASNGDDSVPDDVAADSEAESDGEVVPNYAVRNSREARIKANTEG